VWKKAPETGYSLYTGPVGTHGGIPFIGNSEIVEGGLWSISLYGRCVRRIWRGWGGSFTGDPEGYVEEGSGDEYLSIGAPLGNLEGGSYTGDGER
jgi:hypothetical protein